MCEDIIKLFIYCCALFQLFSIVLCTNPFCDLQAWLE